MYMCDRPYPPPPPAPPQPSLVPSLLMPIITSYQRPGSGLPSVIAVATQALLHSPRRMQRQLLQPLLLAMSPWLMSHAHPVRTTVQLLVAALLERFPPGDPVWDSSSGACRTGRDGYLG